MRYLGTYRFVPPITLKAWARAVVVFAAYLAAVDFGLPFDLAPLSFALALELAILVAGNVLMLFSFTEVWRDGAKAAGWAAALMTFAAVIWGILTTSPEFTHRYWVGWLLGYACVLLVLARWDDGVPKQVWFHDDPEAPAALMMFAGGMVLIALTGLALARVDELAFVAFVTFGVKVMLFFMNWVVLLFLFLRSREREQN